MHIRAIKEDAIFYNIIAESPKGKVNNVKGIKMGDSAVEATINCISIFAHVKALRQD